MKGVDRTEVNTAAVLGDRPGRLTAVSRGEPPLPVEAEVAGKPARDPDAEALASARTATEAHREPAATPNAGGRKLALLELHRLRTAIGRDEDARTLLHDAGDVPLPEQRARLASAMRARRAEPLEVADLESTVRTLARQWRFLLGRLAELNDENGRPVFRDADRVIDHIADLALRRSWVFSPHVRVLPDPFAGRVPAQSLKKLGRDERGTPWISTIPIRSADRPSRPYRLGIGQEPKIDPKHPDQVWQFHRPYLFLDLEVAGAVARHDPSIFRRIQYVASMASHDLSAHSVADAQLPDWESNYPLRTWHANLEQDRILDPSKGVPNLEVFCARLHRVLWSMALEQDGGRAQEAVLAHAQRFVACLERFEASTGDQELAHYLATVYFDKNLYFVIDPAVVAAAFAEDRIGAGPGSFQREIHRSDRQPFGESLSQLGEILASFLNAIA